MARNPLLVPARFVGQAEVSLFNAIRAVLSARAAALAGGQLDAAHMLQLRADGLDLELYALRGIRWTFISAGDPVAIAAAEEAEAADPTPRPWDTAPVERVELSREVPDGRPPVPRICAVENCTRPTAIGGRCSVHAHDGRAAAAGGDL